MLLVSEESSCYKLQFDVIFFLIDPEFVILEHK